MLTIAFDGIAYGMLLFILACGLSVTLGLMNFVNLAHGVFAMLGGYVTALLTTRLGVPFVASLPLAFLAGAGLGAVLERTLYRRLYRRGHLDQVLFTIGLVFMAVTATDYLLGSSQQSVVLPAWLKGRIDLVEGFSVGRYRLFVVVVCAVLAAVLQALLSGTRFGSRLRAAVDDARVAAAMGIDVDRLFAVTFAFGCGLAGFGGALGVEVIGMDPTFPVKYLVYFLIVVTVGGTTGIAGTLAAALLLGVSDVVGKYYVPQIGAFIIYAVMVAVLIVRPRGLFSRGGGR